MGEGNKKLSKRDPRGARAGLPRRSGFLPEGLLNYLALLGWAIAADRDVFTLEEMVEAFDIGDVNPNPARFDLKKAEAINADAHAAAVGRGHHPPGAAVPQGGRRRRRPGARRRRAAARAGDAAGRRADEQADRGRRRCSASCSSTRTTFTRDPADVEKLLDEAGTRRRPGVPRRAGRPAPVVDRRDPGRRCRPRWSTGSGLKPRVAFGPVRVAVTGRRVSPPLFESLELLGRDRSLARLQRALG